MAHHMRTHLFTSVRIPVRHVQVDQNTLQEKGSESCCKTLLGSLKCSDQSFTSRIPQGVSSSNFPKLNRVPPLPYKYGLSLPSQKVEWKFLPPVRRICDLYLFLA